MEASREQSRDEMFDMLLVAGYFRIRIPSLSDFDKLLGGQAWGILCSNYEIDIELDYCDDLPMKQKMRLSEKIIESQRKMKCPIYNLSPHQIQGQDFTGFLPVIKWLLTSVGDTRKERQQYDQKISNLYGQRYSYQFDKPTIEIDQQKSSINKIKSRNQNITQFIVKDPIRVYSSLIEYGEKTAIRQYQSLQLKRGQEGKGSLTTNQQSGQQQSKIGSINESGINDTKAAIMLPQSFAQEISKSGGAKNMLASGVGPSMQKNKKSCEEEAIIKDFDNDGYEIINQGNINLSSIDAEFEERKIYRKNSLDADNFVHMMDGAKNKTEKIKEAVMAIEKEEEEKNTLIAQMAKEKNIFNAEKQCKEESIVTTRRKIVQIEQTINDRRKEQNESTTKQNELSTHNESLKTMLIKIEKKIEKKEEESSKQNSEALDIAATLVSKKDELIQEKKRLKAMAKEEVSELESNLATTNKKLEKVYEKIEQGAGDEIKQAFIERKEIYGHKEKELAEIQRDLNLLERRIQDYPTGSEMTHYFKRYIELFEKVNEECDKQKRLDIIYNLLVDIERCHDDHQNLIDFVQQRFKEINPKKSKEKTELVSKIEEVMSSSKQNNERSNKILADLKGNNEVLLREFDIQLTYQREYYELLRKVQDTYDGN